MTIQFGTAETLTYKGHSICLKFMFPIALLLMFQAVSGQLDTSSLTAKLQQHQKELGGHAAMIVWKDTTLYQRAFGEDNTINTQNNVGCTSAWFTAAVTMVLVEQGKISLDDKVSKYLPIFATYAKKYLTIRHCLANVTGLAPYKGGADHFFQKKKYETLEDEVNAYASTREIESNPGEAFDFNEIGTNIVGRVLEVAAKKSFDRLAMEKLFRPCGMKKSTFTTDRAVDPFAGAVSTPGDVVKFLTMLRNKGTINGKQVLTEASVMEIEKVQTGNAKTGFVPALVQGYGFGLGNWIAGAGQFTAPGLNGCWPVLNTTKNYVAVIFGNPRDREKKEIYNDLFGTVDNSLQ